MAIFGWSWISHARVFFEAFGLTWGKHGVWCFDENQTVGFIFRREMIRAAAVRTVSVASFQCQAATIALAGCLRGFEEALWWVGPLMLAGIPCLSSYTGDPGRGSITAPEREALKPAHTGCTTEPWAPTRNRLPRAVIVPVLGSGVPFGACWTSDRL